MDSWLRLAADLNKWLELDRRNQYFFYWKKCDFCGVDLHQNKDIWANTYGIETRCLGSKTAAGAGDTSFRDVLCLARERRIVGQSNKALLVPRHYKRGATCNAQMNDVVGD